MEQYEVVFKKSVAKDLARIPKKDVTRIIEAIKKLSSDPRPPQAKKLSAQEKYRMRCGVYRILYEIKDKLLVVCVVKVRHRKNAYR